MALTDKLSAIADAIRSGTGGTEKITLDEMATLANTLTESSSYLFRVQCARSPSEIDYSGDVIIPSAPGAATPYGLLNGSRNIKRVIICEGLTRIDGYTFANSGLTSVHLPESLTEIGDQAFDYCANLTSVVIPASVTTIGMGAFGNCASLMTATFKGTPTSLNMVFGWSGSVVQNIYVPWAEGEVSGAPWGATSATIHYNHTGG